MLESGQKVKAWRWAGGGGMVFIITKTSNKAGQMNLKKKKLINLLISFANMFLMLHLDSYRHQVGWDAEHSLLTHPYKEQGEPLNLIFPLSQGSQAAPCTKSREKKSVRREKTLSTFAERDQSSSDQSKMLQKLLIPFPSGCVTCKVTAKTGAQLSFPNGSGNCFISGLLTHHSGKTAELFWVFS